jgi:hypothetical protein
MINFLPLPISFHQYKTKSSKYRKAAVCLNLCAKNLGGDSQYFLHKFIIFFVTLGLKILRLFRLKVLFEADIIKE